MSFKVVVIGADSAGEETRDVIHEIEGQSVTKVHVLTRKGEATAISVEPDEGDIALTFDYMPTGQVHLSDVDKLKTGYGENLTGDDVAATEAQLAEVRGTANVNESFTPEAAEAAAEAEEAGTVATPEVEEEPDYS